MSEPAKKATIEEVWAARSRRATDTVGETLDSCGRAAPCWPLSCKSIFTFLPHHSIVKQWEMLLWRILMF